jgi:hypothetical protein
VRAQLVFTSVAVVLSVSIGVAFQLTKDATALDKANPNTAAIAKGVDYLKVEVPKWRVEHPCYSCHNNGDATRALLVAASKGFDIGTSLDDTLAFLKQPSKWDQNKAPSGFDDKTLAKIQFASALAVAERHGKAASADLEAAAKLLVADQQPDGSWQLDSSQSLGSPATYGTIIANVVGALVAHSRPACSRTNFTDRPGRQVDPRSHAENVLDASATILALELSSDCRWRKTFAAVASASFATASRPRGMGPYVTAAPQVFDTAMAVLALSSLETRARLARSAYRLEELQEAIANGKKYIVSEQKA